MKPQYKGIYTELPKTKSMNTVITDDQLDLLKTTVCSLSTTIKNIFEAKKRRVMNTQDNKPFQWTDELVMKFVNLWESKTQGVNWTSVVMEEFKASHSVSEGEESKRTPSLITEDGKELFVGQKYFVVQRGVFIVWKGYIGGDFKKRNDSKYFSTEEAGNDYINMNKPVLCVLDIHAILLCLSHVNGRDINKYDYNEQIKKSVFATAQSKIKGGDRG